MEKVVKQKSVVVGFSTKYALTGGIQPVTVELHDDGLHARDTRPGVWITYTVGKDFFISNDQARAAAVLAADRKLKALEKQASAIRAKRDAWR